MKAARDFHNYHYMNMISNVVLLTHLSRWNRASKDIFIHSSVEIISNYVQIISDYVETTRRLGAVGDRHLLQRKREVLINPNMGTYGVSA